MPARTFGALCVAALTLSSAVQGAEPAGQPVYRAGDFVVVVRPAELKLENKPVDKVETGVLLGVDQAQGDWLWVTSAHSGWISTRDVMPAEQAVDYYTKAIRRDATNGRLYARRGLCRALNRDFAAALKDYNEALRLRPAEAVYYGDRGCLYLALGDFDRAIGDFREEIKRIAGEPEAKRSVRLQWLRERISDAELAKAEKKPNGGALTENGKPGK